MSSCDLCAGNPLIWALRNRLIPRVPTMTHAPYSNSHHPLMAFPKMLKCPACKSGIARSASLANSVDEADPSRIVKQPKNNFRSFISATSPRNVIPDERKTRKRSKKVSFGSRTFQSRRPTGGLIFDSRSLSSPAGSFPGSCRKSFQPLKIGLETRRNERLSPPRRVYLLISVG